MRQGWWSSPVTWPELRRDRGGARVPGDGARRGASIDLLHDPGGGLEVRRPWSTGGWGVQAWSTAATPATKTSGEGGVALVVR